MTFLKVSTALVLVLLGTCSNEAGASQVKIDKRMIVNPAPMNAAEVPLEKADKEKATTISLNSNDNKASVTKSVPAIEDRKPGTITLKPLTVNFGALTFGIKRKSQLINGFTIDPYKSSFACLSNRGDAIGTSYDLELGVMVTSNIEAFTILGVDYQRPFTKITISNNPANRNDNFLYEFKDRRNYNFSLGGRYYWNTQKPWFPFVGLMGTATFQDSVRADVFRVLNATTPPLGPLTLQRRKTLWGGTFQAGADYQFTDLVSLTLVVALQYTPRVSMSSSSIGGKQITCRDNRNLWSLPLMATLKFTF